MCVSVRDSIKPNIENKSLKRTSTNKTTADPAAPTTPDPAAPTTPQTPTTGDTPPDANKPKDSSSETPTTPKDPKASKPAIGVDSDLDEQIKKDEIKTPTNGQNQAKNQNSNTKEPEKPDNSPVLNTDQLNKLKSILQLKSQEMIDEVIKLFKVKDSDVNSDVDKNKPSTSPSPAPATAPKQSTPVSSRTQATNKVDRINPNIKNRTKKQNDKCISQADFDKLQSQPNCNMAFESNYECLKGYQFNKCDAQCIKICDLATQ